MHSFDPKIAAQVGLNAAVIYQNIVWWCEKNAANKKHIHDGRAWTYNSMKAFETLFPYLSGKQIRTALDKLEQSGLILSGNFNVSGYDRTKWYCPSGPIDLPEKANGIARKGEPIPDSKPVLKPDSKPDLFGSPDPQSVSQQDSSEKKETENIEDHFTQFWSVYPRNYGKAAARKKFQTALKKASPEQIIIGARGYAKHCADEGTEPRFIKHATTWLNQECWTDHEAVPAESNADKIKHLLDLARVEDAMGRPHEARRYRAEAKAMGWSE